MTKTYNEEEIDLQLIKNKHVYQVRQEDLDYFPSLEPSDIGRRYIIVQDCIHFVDEAI